MKKKMLSVLLAAAVICGMAGCSTDGSSSGSGADGSDFLVDLRITVIPTVIVRSSESI